MGKASERRTERVKSLLISTLSEAIRDELSDPRIGIFSITDVNMARDLTVAEVLIAAVGGGAATDDTVKVLNSAAPLLWNRIREMTDLRTVPRLRFTADHRGKYIDEIYTLLDSIGPLPADDPEAADSEAAGHMSLSGDPPQARQVPGRAEDEEH